MITIRKELPKDVAAREALLDLVFGDARFAKPSERLRQGRRAADGLAFTACARADVVGTVRLWNVSAGPNRRRASPFAQLRHRQHPHAARA